MPESVARTQPKDYLDPCLSQKKRHRTTWFHHSPSPRFEKEPAFLFCWPAMGSPARFLLLCSGQKMVPAQKCPPCKPRCRLQKLHCDLHGPHLHGNCSTNSLYIFIASVTTKQQTSHHTEVFGQPYSRKRWSTFHFIRYCSEQPCKIWATKSFCPLKTTICISCWSLGQATG